MSEVAKAPDYFLRHLSSTVVHLSEFERRNREERRLRLYEVAHKSIENIKFPGWEIDEKHRSRLDYEIIGLERVGETFFVYYSEQGRRRFLAAFSEVQDALDYLVSKVSGETRIGPMVSGTLDLSSKPTKEKLGWLARLFGAK